MDDWNDEGVVRLPDFYVDRWQLLIDYELAWLEDNVDNPGGWLYETPYMDHPEILNMLAPLAPHLEELLGGPAAVHLNLTPWITTTRNWHQDSYLNPSFVGDRYAAVWLSFEQIDPDSGPFQFVPGSHFWPQITREKIWALLGDYRKPDWPTKSERVLTPHFEKEIELRNATVETYLPNRGDVLIWHGRLLHRGSTAKKPGTPRRAFIAHFSRIDARPDMPPARRWAQGGWYFPLGARRAIGD